MTLIESIKAAQVELRKQRSIEAAASLTTLIGEAEAIGKNDGNRQVSDAEVIGLIKKFVKNIEITLEAIRTTDIAGLKTADLQAEKRLYEVYLPKQLTEEQLCAVVQTIKKDTEAGPKDMGRVMSILKAKYDGQYDGKMASTVVKYVLAGEA